MIFRTEHPKPQFMRESWMNLNGEWQFETDNDNDGRERGTVCGRGAPFRQHKRSLLPRKPPVGGKMYTDFMNSVWYEKELYA